MAQQHQAVQVQKIFLSSPLHWDVWLKAVKTQALAKEVWDYVNPEGTGPPEPHTPPEITLESFMAKYGISLPTNASSNTVNQGTAPPGNAPQGTDASQGTIANTDDDQSENAGNGALTPHTLPAQAVQPSQPSAVSTTQLNPTQLYEYKKEDRRHRAQLEKVEKQRRNLAELTHYILDRVSDDYRSRILNEQHPRGMIQILKKRVAPTNRAKEIEVTNTWKWLKKTPKDTYLSTWLRRWEEIYEKATELNLPEASGIRPVLDFLDAIEPLSDKFHNYWTEHIQNLQDEDRTDEIPDLYDILNKFRNRVRLRQLQKGKNATAFATYQNTTADKEEDGQKEKDTEKGKEKDWKPRGPCFCGLNHLLDDCDHLHESLRPSNWKEDSKRTAQIQKAERIKWKKDAIERSRKRVLKKQDTHSNCTTATAGNQVDTAQYNAGLASIALASSSSSPVMDSWVLDPAATEHVCNNLNRLEDYRPSVTPNMLQAGTQVLTVHGYGTAYITVQTLNGPAKLRLNNVAYIPGFLANLICFRRFQDKGIQWDTARARLVDHKGDHLCKVLDHHGLWLLEYNPPSSEASGGVSSDEEPLAAALTTTTKKRSQMPREAKSSATVWHQRLGHVGPAVIDHLVRPAPKDDPKGRKTLNGVNITTWDAPETNKCEICAITKAHEIISRRVPDTRSSKPFERIHLDIVPMKEAFNLSQYYVHVNCEYTCVRIVKVTPLKSAIPQAILDILAFIKRRWDCQVALIRTDGESTIQQGTNFEQMLVSEGYHVERSPPDTQALNGKAERAGHVLILRARGLKAQARFPTRLWPEIIIAAAYLLNLTPMEALGWISPLEFLQKELGIATHVPRLAHLVVYGARAYFHNKNMPKLDRLEPNAGIGYLCGYQSSNIYRIWMPAEKTIKPFRDVTFDEGKFYSPDDLDIQAQIRHANEATDIPTAMIMDSLSPEEEGYHGDSTDESDEELSDYPSQQVDVLDREPASDAPQEPPLNLPTCDDAELDIQLPTPRHTPEEEEYTLAGPQIAATGHSDTPEPPPQPSRQDPAPRHEEISADVERPELIIPQRTRGQRRGAYAHAVTRVTLNAGFHCAFAAGIFQTRRRSHQSQLPPEPKNYREMQAHPHSQEWKKATTSEFNKLLKNGTAQIVPIPNDISWRDVLPLIWVWKYKVDEDGYLTNYKARLCVRGDLEKLPDTEETFAATLAARVFRALMAIAAYFNLELQQLDAISAFTNSSLRRKLYVRLPDGFRQAHKCLLLLRALYGLKESGRLWYDEFTGTLADLGLQGSEDEKCLWYNDWLVIFFYVDDVVAMFKTVHLDKWKRFKTDLCDSYKFKDLGDLKWFLGVRVVRDRPNRKLWLCQDAYIDKIASKFKLTHGHNWPTPMALEELGNHHPDTPPSKQSIYHYQQLVGSINYAAVITRADTARTASKLAEFLQNPAPQHLKAAQRAVEYLASTSSLALEYSGPKSDLTDAQNPFQVYSDASFGDCPRTRRSTGGFLITLFGGAIDWRSKRQSCVTLSSTEAELHALTDAAREIQYWKRIFHDIRLVLDQQEYTATCDNRQTIRLLTATTPQFTTKLRHVDIKHHWLREKVQQGTIAIEWIATGDMPADGLTKPLPAQKHLKLLKCLSLVDISGLLARQEPAAH